MDFYPLGLLALAVTRLRVCLCKGNADVLITKMSAFLTLGLCLLPLSISVILNAFISFNIADSGSSCLVHYCISMTRTPGQNLQSWFHLFTIITFDILPVILTFVLYGVIQKTYRESENNIQRRRTLCGTQQRRMTIVLHRKSGRSIGLSLFLLTFTILIAWTPYVALRLMSWLETPMNQGMHHAMTLYCIVFLYLLSPVGEGLLLSQKRENVSDIFKSAYAAIQARCRVEPYPRSAMGFPNNELIDEQIVYKSRQPTNLDMLHGNERHTPIFFLGNDQEIIQSVQSPHGANCSREWLWKTQDSHIGAEGQTVARFSNEKDKSVPNGEAKPKKRKVCFSTDAEEESCVCTNNDERRQRISKSSQMRWSPYGLAQKECKGTASPRHTPPFSPGRPPFSIPTDCRDDVVNNCCYQKNRKPLINNGLIHQRRKIDLTHLHISESGEGPQCYFSDCESKRFTTRYSCHPHKCSCMLNRSPVRHFKLPRDVYRENNSPNLYFTREGTIGHIGRADSQYYTSSEASLSRQHSSLDTVFGYISPKTHSGLSIPETSPGETRHAELPLRDFFPGTFLEQLPANEIRSKRMFTCPITDSVQVQVKKRRSGSVCAPMQDPLWRSEIQQQEYGPQNNGSTSGAVSPTRLYNQPPKMHFDEAEAPSEDVRQDSKSIQKGRPPKLSDYF